MGMFRTSGRPLGVEALEQRLALATVYALNSTGNLLFRFDSATPGTIDQAQSIGGLGSGEALQGIDFRPANGQLFGVGVTGTTARLLTINPVTGATAQVGATFTVSGSDFGFDFNPTNDLIRVVSDANINLAVNPNTGVVTTQSNLNPGDPNVVGAAYSNNVSTATSTTLFVIDSVADRLHTQAPPAAGALTALPNGLGVNTSGAVGFDITSDGTAYAALNVSGASGLYTINTSTGVATLVGQISFTAATVRGLAVATNINTSTTLTSSPSTTVFGEQVTFTATVDSTIATPTGSVTFVDVNDPGDPSDDILLGTDQLDASGNANLSVNILSVGSHTILATFNANASFNSSSDTAIQTVNQGTTSTSLTDSPDPSTFGQSVVFTATVTANAPSTLTPTGSVTFFDLTTMTPLGTSPVNNGQALLNVNSLSAGLHAIQATYNDAAGNYASSSDTETQFVNVAATMTTLASSGSPSALGQAVTFTATVDAPSSPAVPTGTVVFSVDGVDAATDSVDTSGQATFTTSTLGLGPHVVGARYVSDSANFANSVSTPVTQDVQLVTVINGKLTVEGSGEDDIVTITGVGTGTGTYIVTRQQGLQPPQMQTVNGVSGDICVNLHAGNDQLTMNNIYIRGSIIVDMENGNDTVTLGNADVVSTQANLDIDLGTENDVLNGRRIFIAGNQILAGGDGNDSMTFDGFASPFTLGTSAAGNANWSTGNGNDTVQIIYAFIVGAFAIDLGVGTDSLNIFGSAASGDVTFLGGAGNDSLRVDTNFFDASLLLNGGADNDTVFLANGLGIDVGTINTGAGNDTVTVRNETQVSATIDTGGGADTVDVRSSAVDRFFALLGDDDDELTVFGNLLRIEADLDGGAGSADRLIDLGNDVRGALRTRNFELFG